MQSSISKIALLVLSFIFCSNLFAQNCQPTPELLKLKAPSEFKAKFETTEGDFEITAERDNSPLAVDRLYQLIKCGYFTDIPFYRVVPDFVVQFGTLDAKLDEMWTKNSIKDEPVVISNRVGTISFARAGKDTRDAQLFINLKNNIRLDTSSNGSTIGFPVVAFVSKGMDVVEDIYDGYKDEPRQMLQMGKIENLNFFLKENFPKLDYIKKAYIIE